MLSSQLRREPYLLSEIVVRDTAFLNQEIYGFGSPVILQDIIKVLPKSAKVSSGKFDCIIGFSGTKI